MSGYSTRMNRPLPISRILVGIAALLFAVAFCMCLGFIFEKPEDILDVFAVGFAGFTLYALAHLA